MTERNPDTQEIEIDLSRLLRALLRRWWVLFSATVCGGLLLFSIAFFILTPRYTATATMYVMNSTSSGSSMTNSDLTASQSLVDTYIAILKTRTTLEQAIEATGVSYTYEELSDMVSANAVNSTELFEISVTSTDPEEAAALANALAELLPDRFTELVGGTAAYLADRAVPPSEPSSPHVTRLTLIGLIAGLLLSAAAVVILDLVNDEICRDEELMQLHPDIPILASIPNLQEQDTFEYGHGEKQKKGVKRRKKPAAAANADGQDIIGARLNFAGKEAHNMLRTNVSLSLPGSGECKVVGMTSSLPSEGKSTTSVNLAYSLAVSGCRVLLMECDMRKPSQGNRLNLERSPGLSNLLTGGCTMAQAVQATALHENFQAVTAGDIPPNPSELLNSKRMAECVRLFQEQYDYILLDLPPITAVTDAVLAARLVDGMVLMVHMGYCGRSALRDALNHLNFSDVKLLGFVTTFNSIKSKRYGKYKYEYGYGENYSEASPVQENP